MLNLYNSLTQKIEPFTPLKDKEVTMYVCGITPYDTTHLGHAFTYISFDILLRILTSHGYTVKYVQNVTDIDDDILKKAKAVGKQWNELGDFWTQKFLHDLQTLNLVMPTHYVKATDNIPAIIEVIEKLIKKGFAYEKENNVYFRVSKDKNYGKLSRYTVDQMTLLSKERGAKPDDPNKENPLDFVLWQQSQPDEPSWKSPWGNGRPGWHIECSAMNYTYLGEQVDIHGGGRDLIYPHHESEIAQSENFTGKKPFVKYWMHTGAVIYEGEKMSKSLGNLIMVSDLLKHYSANTIRYVLLTHHYREPWEFHKHELDAAKKNVEQIEKAYAARAYKETAEETSYIENFANTLADDLDTPKALTILQKVALKQLEKPTKTKQDLIKDMCSILGFNLT